MRVKISFFISAFWVSCVHLSNAQQYPFVQYSPKDGLVNTRVASAKQDSRGRLYFLTFNGLSVYDGARFTNYTTTDGLGDNLVNDIWEAGDDSFLVATNTELVNTLVKGKLGKLQIKDHSAPLINRFLPDDLGNLYALGDKGLYKWEQEHFIRLPISDSLGKDIGKSLARAVWYNQKLLIVPWEQDLQANIILYDIGTGKVNDYYRESVVRDIAKSKKNEIWIATSEGIRVFDTLALQNGKIVLKSLSGAFSSLKGWKPLSVFFDKQNTCWTNNEDTIIKIQADGEKEIFTDPQSMHTSHIVNCFIDREDILWVLTNGGGIFKLADRDIQMITSLNKNKLSAYFSAIAKDFGGEGLWLYNNTDHSMYLMEDNQIKRFSLNEKIFVSNIIVAEKKLYLIADNTIYKVSDKYDPSAYRHMKKIYSLNRGEGYFGAGIIDPYGNIIINTGRESFSILAFINERKIVRFPSRYIIDNMLIDRQLHLWALNRTRDLTVYAIHPTDPSHYLEELHNYEKEVPCKSPRTFTIDRNNGIWIGSRDQGLFHMELQKSHLVLHRQLTTNDGLTDNFVCHLTCNPNNEIWACTQTGLDKIILKDGKYLIDNITKDNSIFQMMLYAVCDNRNRAWALGDGGNVITVKESAHDSLRSPPSLMVTELRVNNQLFDHYIQNPVFSFKNNSLSFFVAAPSFIDEKQITYYFRLGGGPDSNWSEASHNPVFNFLNLPPGRYQLNMKASFPSGWYPTQFLNYSFIIRPPWWQTWWFRFLSIAIIFLAIAFAIRSYIRRKLERERILMEKKQAVEKERSRIATDMHDDLGAGLSRIKFLSETIGMKRQLQQSVDEDITSISGYATEMIGKMGEIVWALNEKNDSLSDLLAYSRSYASEYLLENGISCKVIAPPEFPSSFVSGEFRRNVYLVIKEALHNIVKHSRADKVIIDMMADKQLVISIRDNGIGFERANARAFSNGLNNMQKRTEEIQGKLEIIRNNGTTVILTAPFRI